MANRVAKLFNKKYSNLLLHWGLFFYSPHSEIKEQKIQRKNGYIHHLKIFSTWEQIPKLCWRWRYLWREIKWERNQAGKECFWTTIYNADLITLKREMKKQDEVESTPPPRWQCNFESLDSHSGAPKRILFIRKVLHSSKKV